VTAAASAIRQPARPLGRAVDAVRSDPFWWWVLGCGAVGLVLRLVWVFYAARVPAGLYDPARYFGIASNIAHGRGYADVFTIRNGVPVPGEPSAYYPPGYPYFLGSIAWLQRVGVLPHGLPRVAGVAQALLGSATVVLVGVLGRNVWSRRAGVIAAAILAVYPNLVMHAAALLSETLFIFLFVAAVVTLVPAAGRPGPLSRGRLALAGVLFALSVLVRPVSLAALPLLALVWWLQGRKEGRGIGLRRAGVQVGWLLGCTVLLVVPWTIRNAVRMHAFVPLSTNNGDNLCIGYSPEANGAFRLAKACITKDVAVDGSRAEVRHDHEATHLAVKYATADPGRIPWLVTRRFYYLMQRDDDALRAVQSYGEDNFIPAHRAHLLERTSSISWRVVEVVGALGVLLLLFRGRRDHLLVALAGLSTLVLPLLTFADARFKVPFVPFLILGAGVLLARLTGSRPDPPTPVEETVVEVVEAGGLLTEAGRSGPTAAP
jgi:hypothetical protein